MIAFVLIFFQSVSPVRHAFYEAFLHFHIALAIMAFVALWYHLKHLALQRVLLATLILWGLDVSFQFLSARGKGRSPLTMLGYSVRADSGVSSGATLASDAPPQRSNYFLGMLPAWMSLWRGPGPSVLASTCTFTFRRWDYGPRIHSLWRGSHQAEAAMVKSGAHRTHLACCWETLSDRLCPS